MVKTIICLIISSINTAFMLIYSTKYLQFFQLKSYKVNPYLLWLKKENHMHIDGICLTICFLVFMIFNLFCKLNLSPFIDTTTLSVLPLFFLFFFFIVAHCLICNFPKYKKTPLVFTAKIKRLIIFEIIFYYLINFLSIYFLFSNLIFRYIFIPILFLSSSYLLLLSNLLLSPLEKLIQFHYITKSKKLLKKHNDCTIIAITGSGGKTSTKNILYHFLKDKYEVIKTPSSYNTPLGICKSINAEFSKFDNTLKPKVFIVEMGAKQPKDIEKLCKYVKPTYGIITSVLPQHIETFKTIEKVYQTKKELPDFLKDSLCVYNGNNELSSKMHDEKTGKKAIISTTSKADYYAKNIGFSDLKTHFQLCHKNKIFQCETQLLGDKNIVNILLAVTIAHNMKISLKTISNLISTLPQTEHRLQLIKSPAGFYILDDTYNCNIDSAKLALNVLSKFSGNKIVCTPGIIEGGKMQSTLNGELANAMADIADKIIIIGNTNKKTFEHIFNQRKYNHENLFYVSSLEDAKKLFQKLIKKNDCLLLLNDLPDDYN